jgi:hypothetical protein
MRLSWPSNLAVPPAADITLGDQSTVMDESLNAHGDHLITRVAVWQVSTEPLSGPAYDHRDFPPGWLNNGQNSIVDLRISHRNIQLVNHGTV